MEKKIYNCIVIDDEHLARKLVGDYISKIDHLKLAGSFDNPVKAIDVIAHGDIDVIFTDIEMADLTGIDFIQNLPLQNRPIVVFITAYPEYAVQGFEINADEYLLKPVSFARFVKAVNKITSLLQVKHKLKSIERLEPQPQKTINDEIGFIIVKSERKVIKLPYDEILFIEGALEYVTFQTPETKVMGLFSLKSLEEQLPAARFMRIHKSYIVSVNKITEIDGNQVRVGKFTIPVSKTMRPKLLDVFSGR